ncbi:MAG: hypothetical protein LBG31_02845 [Prevotellaceae bacterium]|jgi:hypothetical protein|nr:hypothetical protein [Prevotellaceae bacterium]
MNSTNNLSSLPEPVVIPGIMQLLREIRDKNSLHHMNMTPRELLEELAQHRNAYSLWPDDTKFANSPY